MTEPDKNPKTVVLTDVTEKAGAVWRAVTLTEDNGLALRGHDLGRGVSDFFGLGEYEFERRLSPNETRALCELLAVPTVGDLLAAIASRFPACSGLEDFLKERGIPGQFWSRVGD